MLNTHTLKIFEYFYVKTIPIKGGNPLLATRKKQEARLCLKLT